VLCTLTCARVSAHPLGNFTINHLAVVTTDKRDLRVRYILDIAEIPSFQIMHARGAWTLDAKRMWMAQEAQRVAGDFVVTVDGSPLKLALTANSANTRPGAGGLPTLYWTGDYAAAVAPAAHVTVSDHVYADRPLGWRDIALPGHSDPTQGLRAYPSALIASPRHNDNASFDISGGRIVHAVAAGDGASYGAATLVRSSALSDLFARDDQTPWLVLLTVLAAFGLGALHGLEPGHGKALLAFTLVGARANFKQAAILAGALTFAHTIAVLLLGVALFVAADFVAESAFAWIALVSGLAVAFVGARSFAVALDRLVPRHHHASQHHAHAMPGTEPLHFSTAVVAAMSGGIAPCPAAIVVLLAALHLHRVGYGLALIVIFSLGLASILTGLGFAVVRGAAWLQRQGGFSRVARFAPLATAAIISTIGAAMLAQAFTDRGVPVPAVAAIALTLAALAASILVPHIRVVKTAHS
jgi:ABC-type nickel/cobalt efflux system permease component RcnA